MFWASGDELFWFERLAHEPSSLCLFLPFIQASPSFQPLWYTLPMKKCSTA